MLTVVVVVVVVVVINNGRESPRGNHRRLRVGHRKSRKLGSQNRKKQQETKFLAVKNSQSALPDLENWRSRRRIEEKSWRKWKK